MEKRLDKFTLICISYWVFSVMVSIFIEHSNEIEFFRREILQAPTVATLSAADGAIPMIPEYFFIMWAAFPLFLIVAIINSPPANYWASREIGNLIILVLGLVAVLALHLWILIFINEGEHAGKLMAVIFLSSHLRIGLGFIFGMIFTGFLMSTWAFVFGMPRLWWIYLSRNFKQ